MLLEDIQKSIDDMNDIQQLEQVAKDSKNQERLDNSFAAAVNENHKVVAGVDRARSYLRFTPSRELKSQMLRILTDSMDSINKGTVQDSKIRFLNGQIKALKESVETEWAMFYAGIANRRISTLTTVQNITPDPTKTGYAITKMKNGSVINYSDTSNLRLMSEGVRDADTILGSMGLTEEILQFLNKVSGGKATILDLTDPIVQWIKEERLTGKFVIGFGK